MTENSEYKTSSLIPRWSSCMSGSNSGKSWAILAMIFTFFQRALTQPCSNNLTFPYHLEKTSGDVGYCLPLELPTKQAGITTTIMISLFNSATTEIARILQCPNVVLSNYTDCCIIQNFNKLGSLCNKAITWQLALDANLEIKPSSKELTCVQGPQDCPQSPIIVMDVILIFFAIVVLCAISLLVHKGVERCRTYNADCMDRVEQRRKYESI